MSYDTQAKKNISTTTWSGGRPHRRRHAAWYTGSGATRSTVFG